MNRDIKFRFRYTNGTDWIFHVFTMEQILNGEPFEVLADSPLLKNYYSKGWDQFTGYLDIAGVEVYEGDFIGPGGNCVEFVNGEWCINGDRPLWVHLANEVVTGNVHESSANYKPL